MSSNTNDMVKFWLVGDSTACIYGSDDDYALPRAGWGMYLNKFIDNAQVINIALSGRSSKSFTLEEEYNYLKCNLNKGDYLLIQFGHNDQKRSTLEDQNNRYTAPNGEKEDLGSFKNSLYNNYITLANEKEATPILLTPIVRRSFDDNGNICDTHQGYNIAMLNLADELNINCIDMTKITSEIYQKLGFSNTAKFHAMYKDTYRGAKGIDNTHLNHYGAEVVAYNAAKHLSKIESVSKYVNNKTINKQISNHELIYNIIRLISENYANNAEEECNNKFEAAVATAKQIGLVQDDINNDFYIKENISTKEILKITINILMLANKQLFTIDKLPLKRWYNITDIEELSSLQISEIFNDWAYIIEQYIKVDKDMGRAFCYDLMARAYSSIYKVDENYKEQSFDQIEVVE